MARGRIYTVSFSNVSVSAVQDLFSLQATAGMAFAVHEVAIGQVGAVSVGNLRLAMKRFTGGYSIGSGGSAPTPIPVNPHDVAATVTARANDTVQTSGGTSVIVRGDVFNVINGYLWLPQPNDQIIIGLSSAFVVSLDTAPASTIVVNATMTLEELF